MKTDFLINESSTHILYDLNLLKNGFSNRLNKSNFQKMKIQSEFLYEILKINTPIVKIIFTLFFSFYFFMVFKNYDDVLKIIFNFVGFAFWIYGIHNAIDLGGVYTMLLSLGINYLRFRFNQINEKLLLIYNDKKKFNIKKLLKIMSEHKSIERKTQLYNLRINRSALGCLMGFTIGIVANLHIITFSNDPIHRIFSTLTALGVLIFETIIILEMVTLTDAAHLPYATLNSIIVKKKIDLKTKFKV